MVLLDRWYSREYPSGSRRILLLCVAQSISERICTLRASIALSPWTHFMNRAILRDDLLSHSLSQFVQTAINAHANETAKSLCLHRMTLFLREENSCPDS